ncbi:MAG: Asp-tRNA(Asn)/Glu-tRNA(Gln) amidotransferase GatCAB subunit B, partial [Pseudomonadota bacterium]|nr:Asp-tRNA(Asn)/Glu-tRNA(Gln) amidotransferase GatCAB subunit B [Pseudomonadota bacterium]
GLANYFEHTIAISDDPLLTANWVKGELLANLKRDNLSPGDAPVTPELLSELLLKIKDHTISGKIAKTVFSALWQKETDSVDAYIEAKGLKQVSDSSALEPIVDQIIADNPKQVEQFQAGKTKVLDFFVGQVMKQTDGTANPKQVNELVAARLKSAE